MAEASLASRGEPIGWPSRASVRTRATLAATVVVALALLAAGALFVWMVQRTLTDEVLSSLRLRAADLGALVADDVLPRRLVEEPAEDEFIQVIDDDGEVVAASPELEGEPALVAIGPGEWTTTGVPYDDDTFLALASSVRVGDEVYRLIVGRTLEPVAETTALVTLLLAIGLPVVLALVAVTTWTVLGRALAPVERMRREVHAISAAELHRRVLQPRTGDEIARLATTMNRMLDRLDQAQRRQRQLVSDTSHELRSPIASIREQAEVALAHPDRTSTAALAEGVLADDLRLQRLVDDLLLLARADEHSLRLAAKPLDLDDLVFEAADRLRRTTSLRIDTTLVSAARVDGDGAALRRAVDNLADNAARHARTNVAFSLVESGQEAVLSVEDDGPGIPAADRERVFERFVRLDDARSRDGGGSGLGLAIVGEVARAYGGRAGVVDGRLGGARVEIRLPATDPFSEESGSAG